MRFVFPPWANTATRIALVAFVTGAIGCVGGLMVFVRSGWRRNSGVAVDQPVSFDHRHHVRDDGIDCLYCHSSATRGPNAGVPATAVCMGCHNQVWSDSTALEPVRRSYFSGEPIRWNRVHHVPDFVYFNHAAHLHVGVGCSTCHGRVDQMAEVYQVSSLTMRWCLDCHRNPGARLRPVDRITDMAWDERHHDGKLAEELVAKLHVQSKTDCSTCHR